MDRGLQQTETAQRLNKVRIARAAALLSPLQRHLFKLIPLLFHYHRAGYPGYNGPMTPAGIHHYQIDEDTLKACQTLDLVEPVTHFVHQPALEGVYCMGSTASFGQNPNSDIDVWLVHDRLLSPQECNLLQEKSQLISQWFLKFDFEVNIYLVHPQQFTAQQAAQGNQARLGVEHSGSAQHWLLLEEFYRSHIHLAGKSVAWWPKAVESEHHLFLGDISQLPANEYFGASLWQLYKGLDKPHKALLKVLLLEAYASDYPNTQLVSEQVWQYTLEGNFSAANDSYLLLFEAIENYLLKKGDMRRLEVARRCFYLKCGIRLTHAQQAKDWRYHKLAAVVKQWQWSDSLLETLDACEQWDCGQLQWFNQQLNELMLGSYQTLLQFASTHKLSESLKIADLGLLTRKLHTYFSDDSQQIISLNRLWSHSVAEAHLTLVYGSQSKTYFLYRCNGDRKSFIGQRPVYQSHSKAKILVWATLNGVAHPKTQWFEYGESEQQGKRLQHACARLVSFFGQDNWQVSKLDLCQPWHYRKAIFLLNFNADPTEEWTGQEIMVDYMNASVFSLGREKRNLLQSIDVICQNSWGEWHCHHFEGDNAILVALEYMTPGMKRAGKQLSVEVISCSKKLKSQFERSVRNLAARAVRLSELAQTSSTMVYPLKVGRASYGLFFNSKGMEYQDLHDAKAFYQLLSKRQVLELPRPNLGNEPFSKIPEIIQDFAARGAIQYFLRQGDDGLDVFILNETNELEHYVQAGSSIEDLVSQVSQYHAFEEPENDSERFNLPQFFKLERVDGELAILPFGVTESEAQCNF
ncbi:class I adenylate cyclase [Shewanella sp. Scap07]|uniref:class I adenylate cyclase n=1 Tax=Shewanella sp. Scap07 TaxID=2589987 RepID=UPI0015BC7844|nr:class I adenylate cyclase [Shewanella sp. Scap07]QLE84018.1 class I adenylate cyclase [Shewanella sp. Scap07]